MKPGKVSENVYNRSIHKHVKENQRITKGAELDCALFACQTMSLPVAETLLMRHTLYAGFNDLYAKGATPGTVSIAITLAERTREIKLSNMMEEAVSICNELGVTIVSGHTEISESVKCPVISVMVTGEKNPVSAPKEKKSPVGYDIVVTKYIGMEGASLIASKKEDMLRERFPKALIEEVKGFEKYLSILPEAATAIKSGAGLMTDIREGGIFASLWELSKLAGTGLTIDIKKIPMKQSVVEICNYLQINPYELLSTGSLLLAVEDGEALTEELLSMDIPAAVIGKLTDSNDKVIVNDEEIRYLDLPKPDQIREIIKE